jgi:hypothetical protein
MALSFNWWRQSSILCIFIYSGVFGHFRVFAMLCRQVRVTQVAELWYGFTQSAKETESLWHEDKPKRCRSYAASLPHSKTCYHNRHSRDNKNEASRSMSIWTHVSFAPLMHPLSTTITPRSSHVMTLPALSTNGTDANIWSRGQGKSHLRAWNSLPFTKTHQWTLSWAKWIQSTPSILLGTL